MSKVPADVISNSFEDWLKPIEEPNCALPPNRIALIKTDLNVLKIGIFVQHPNRVGDLNERRDGPSQKIINAVLGIGVIQHT
jgi:hypothetical protein